MKRAARAYGHDVEVFTVGQVICRPTQREADDYYRHANIEHADWGAIERMLELRGITPRNTAPEDYAARRQYFAANAVGGLPFVGTPDRVAEQLAIISRAGLRGIAVSFVNFLADLPYFCDEVLPRLARMGLRERQS